jgi:hypothetical protein
MLKMNSCIYVGEKFSQKNERVHLWFENCKQSLEETCIRTKSMLFLITPIIWNFKNLYESLHKLSVVSVWMRIYLHILAEFFNSFIFSDFSFDMHIFEFFQVFSCFNPNFTSSLEFQKRIFKNLLQNLVQMHILIMQM